MVDRSPGGGRGRRVRTGRHAATGRISARSRIEHLTVRAAGRPVARCISCGRLSYFRRAFPGVGGLRHPYRFLGSALFPLRGVGLDATPPPTVSRGGVLEIPPSFVLLNDRPERWET